MKDILATPKLYVSQGLVNTNSINCIVFIYKY
uniref:Uncharacterized protein n=1 Tax=Anguilla anguilla TaxID=7936 RepID=A0A0E9U1H6_ANGAN